MPRRKTRTPRSASARRCLIVERHAWETGFAREQLQIPLEIAERFFGKADARRPIVIQLADAPAYKYECSVSVRYKNGTRRVNGLPFLGLLGSCFVFFGETDVADTFEMWVQYDKPIVVARFAGWTQGRSSQHGRGRLATIVTDEVDRPILRMKSSIE